MPLRLGNRFRRAYRAVSRSEFFDKAFYMRSNPSIAALGLDPVVHYIKYGGRNGIDPSTCFSSNKYLEYNPDVAAAEWNPLAHFELHGRGEGRKVWTPRALDVKDGSQLERHKMSLTFSNPGHCPCCGHDVTFNLWENDFRSGYLCSRCACVPRERALMVAIETFYPDWRNLKIHESSPGPRGASLTLARECSGYTSSQYHPSVPEGETHSDGWRCENLEHQTFADESFDLVITQDVLEHVFDIDATMKEISRTLKKGGAHIGTVPLVRGRDSSFVCATRNPDGSITHFVNPPEYHGNPVDGGGALVTYWWGYDLANRIDNAAPMNTLIFQLVDRGRGVDGPLNEVLISFKL